MGRLPTEVCARAHDPGRRYFREQVKGGRLYIYAACHDCDVITAAKRSGRRTFSLGGRVFRLRRRALGRNCECGHSLRVHDPECYSSANGRYDCECIRFRREGSCVTELRA